MRARPEHLSARGAESGPEFCATEFGVAKSVRGLTQSHRFPKRELGGTPAPRGSERPLIEVKFGKTPPVFQTCAHEREVA